MTSSIGYYKEVLPVADISLHAAPVRAWPWCEWELAARCHRDRGLTLGPVLQEEAFWQKRQVKLRQMSGLKFSDENCHEPGQENYCAVPLSLPLQLNSQVLTPLDLTIATE